MSDFLDHELSSYLFGSHQVSAGRHYPKGCTYNSGRRRCPEPICGGIGTSSVRKLKFSDALIVTAALN